jgi:hypothetical protein
VIAEAAVVVAAPQEGVQEAAVELLVEGVGEELKVERRLLL